MFFPPLRRVKSIIAVRHRLDSPKWGEEHTPYSLRTLGKNIGKSIGENVETNVHSSILDPCGGFAINISMR
jgi:hypothetical protein